MNSKETLSNEEMSALNPPKENSGESSPIKNKGQVIPYNFRRPDRLSKEQVRSIYLLHDLFAHNLSSSLPLFLRAAADIDLISVEQQSFGEYLKGLSDPTTIFTVAVESLKGIFVIEMNSSIAFPIIDRLLGGNGEELKEPRAATDLELNVLEGFLAVVIENYREVWSPVCEFETEITGRETRPQMAQIVSPNEVVATVAYQLQIGESKGTISICLPVEMIEDVIEKLNPASYSPDKEESLEATRHLLSTLSTVRFPIKIELDDTQTGFSDLLSIAPGDILRTNHRVDQPANIKIGGLEKFIGNIASHDGRMVVQISDMKNVNLIEANA